MKMMMAYTNGNLMQIIDGAIYKSEVVRKTFFALFDATLLPAIKQRREIAR